MNNSGYSRDSWHSRHFVVKLRADDPIPIQPVTSALDTLSHQLSTPSHMNSPHPITLSHQLSTPSHPLTSALHTLSPYHISSPHPLTLSHQLSTPSHPLTSALHTLSPYHISSPHPLTSTLHTLSHQLSTPYCGCHPTPRRAASYARRPLATRNTSVDSRLVALGRYHWNFSNTGLHTACRSCRPPPGPFRVRSSDFRGQSSGFWV
jgi:hypothetical protein